MKELILFILATILSPILVYTAVYLAGPNLYGFADHSSFTLWLGSFMVLAAIILSIEKKLPYIWTMITLVCGATVLGVTIYSLLLAVGAETTIIQLGNVLKDLWVVIFFGIMILSIKLTDKIC